MKILTVISNYNEEQSINKTILDFKENATISSDLLVIDNCSIDDSIDYISKSNVKFLRHPVNTGGSSGVIKTALLYSFINNYDIYCHMDGDNQHNADELHKLIKPISDGKADIVIGSRFLKKNPNGFRSYIIRRLGIFYFSFLLSLFTGQKITDLTSGFRAYNRRAIYFFSKKFKHEIEPCVQMLLVASFAGLSIKEVPVLMKPRLSGKSEIDFINAIKFPFYGIMVILGTLLQKKSIKDLANAIKH